MKKLWQSLFELMRVSPSIETKNKISEGVKRFIKNNPTKIGFQKGHIINIGRVYSEERNKKISGSNHYNWKGGITPEMERLRKSQKYKLWRKIVFERDNYTCVECGISGSETPLNADHIKPFAHYPELRFELSNGRTLCISCHEKTESYKNKFYEKAIS